MNITTIRRLSALAGICLLLAACGNSQRETIHPTTGPLACLVTDTGSVVHREPYALTPVVNGKIVSCSIQEGDRVSAGEELYAIDSTDLENQITQASLSLATAQEGLRQALDAQDDLTVRAKADGVVTAVHVHTGDFVNVGTPIAQIVDSANLTLTLPFSRSDAAAIAPGSAALVSFTDYSGQTSATVTKIYSAPTPLSGGREGVYIELHLQNPGALTAGAMAMATVGEMASMESAPVAYATEQAIYSTQSGQVSALLIEAGDRVTDGQAVMVIDNAAVINAAANAALSLESAQAALAQLEAKRADFHILSPVDGVITTRYAKAGDYAAAANPLAILVDPEDLRVEAAIDELYIEKIWPGQQATVTFTADTGEQTVYTAQVHRISDTGSTVGGVTDYTVELTLENTDSLKAGMNVDVAITTARRDSCLQLPTAAIMNNQVQVIRDGKEVTVPVSTGISGGGYTEILDGLTESDEVILP